MKILHFLWGLAQGGSESLAVDLANEQCKTNQVVLFVANDNIDEFLVSRLNSAVRLVRMGRPEGSRNPLWIAKLLAMLQALGPDVVHSHCDKIASLGRFIAAPMVLTVHANGIALSAQSSRFAALCCISQAVEADINSRYPHLKTSLVPNGVRTSDIALRNTTSSTTVRAVQVSRLVHTTKGQDLLIDALKIINEGSDSPLLTVDFIGTGPSLNYLLDLVTAKDATAYCRFLGAKSRENVFAALKNYGALVQPSRDEGFGLTVAEGMAAGIPVVISDLPGPMEVIDNGRYGYFFKSNDAAALVTVLRTMLSEIDSPAASARLISAREYVIQHYDLALTSERYISIYKEVCLSRPS